VALPNGSSAQWRAWVYDGRSTNLTYMGVRSFTTAPGLSPPTQVTPANGATAAGTLVPGVGVDVNFTVSGGGGLAPLQYLVIACDSGNVCVSSNGGAYSSSSSFTLRLGFGKVFSWTAHLKDAAGQTATSGSALSFTTLLRPNNAPAVPTLNSPADGATGVAAIPTLDASSSDPNGDPVQLQYEICPASGANCLPKSPWVTGPWSPSSALAFNTSYVWRVQARDQPPVTAGTQLFSAVSANRSFKTGANTGNAVTAPVVIGPGGPISTEPTAVTTRPFLQVSASDADPGDGIEYRYQICAPMFPEESSSNQCFESPGWVPGAWQVPSNLDFGVEYKWRAWARNTGDPGAGIASTWSRKVVSRILFFSDPGQLAVGSPYVDQNIDDDGRNGINEAVGSFTHSQTDATLVTVGSGIDIQRTYNARNRSTRGAFGLGWSSNLDVALTQISPSGATTAAWNDPIVITFQDGRKEIYSLNSNGAFVPAGIGVFGDLVKDPAGWTGYRYSTSDRTKFFFNVAGRLIKIEDRNGNTVNYSYNAQGRVNQIVDAASGRSLGIEYQNDLVWKISTQSISDHGSSLTWTYSYANKQLNSVCPPTSATVPSGCWIYEWANDRLFKVTNPRGFVDTQISYDTSWFQLFAPANSLPNASFETAIGTSWTVTGGGAGTGQSTSQGAVFGTNALVATYGGAGTSVEMMSEFVPVVSGKQYTISGRVKGSTTGRVTPYVYFYDQFQQSLGSTAAPYGGESTWSTTPNWMVIRGQFLVPETAKFAKVSFQWPSQQGHNGIAALDGVMLERGDGIVTRVSSRTDGEGKVTTFNYAVSGSNLEVLTDDPRPDVGASKDVYNEKYQLISHTDSSGLAQRTTQYTYDANGFVSTVVDPANRTVLSQINNVRGQPTSRTRLGAGTEYFTYYPNTDLVDEYRDGRSSSSTDTAFMVKYSYDAAGNQTQRKDPVGNSEVWEYTVGTEPAIGGSAGQFQPKGLLKTYADRSGLVISYAYNRAGDRVRTDHPANGVQVVTVDEIGRVKTQGRELSGATVGVSEFKYDVRSRLTIVLSPEVLNTVSGVTHRMKVETEYDPNNNPRKITTSDVTPAGSGGDTARVVENEFDKNDRLTKVIEPQGRITQYAYDEINNQTRVTDARGVITETAYDARSLPTSVKVANYQETANGQPRSITLSTNTYDNLGRLDTKTDALGRVEKYYYDDADRLQKATRPGYKDLSGTQRELIVQRFVYDNLGNLKEEWKGNDLQGVTRKFDSRGFIEFQTVTSGTASAPTVRTTTFTYDPEGRVKTSVTGRYAQDFDYYPASKLLKTSKVSGVPTAESYEYDSWGRLKKKTDKRSFVTTNTYDIADRLTKVEAPQVEAWNTDASAFTLSMPTVVYGYNTFGEKTHTKDERGLITKNTWDQLARVTQVTFPTNGTMTPTESYAYDPMGNQTSFTNRRSQVTNTEYDSMGRARVQYLPAPIAGGTRPVTSTNYDDAGQLKHVIDPNGVKTTFTYDNLGRKRTETLIVRQLQDAQYTTTFDYDDAGNQVLVRNNAGKTWSTQFNRAGQIVRQTDPTGAVAEYGYEEPTGWQSYVLDAGLRRQAFNYDDAGRRTVRNDTNPSGSTVIASESWQYDDTSNVKSHTRPNGAIDSYTYDAIGRVSTSNTQIGPTAFATVTAGYDVAGNLVRIVDPRSYVTTMSYNNWGMLATTTEPTTTAFPNIADRQWSVSYNVAGDPATETRPGGVTVSRSYDLLGRLKTETGSGAGVTSASRSFDYDLGGRLTSAGTQTFAYFDTGQLKNSSGPSGTSSYEIDSVGRVASRTDAAGASSFTYTDRNELKTYTVNGSASTLEWWPSGEVKKILYPASVERSFAYDDLGRLRDDWTVKGGVTVSRREHTYNADSSVKSTTITQAGNPAAGTYSYSYDEGSRLRGVAGPVGATAFDYDAAGNRTQANGQTFVYNERNRLMSGGGSAYAWSARGTLTSITGTGAGTFAFDGLDRLRTAGSVTYSYDDLDRVLSRSPSGSFAYAGTESDPVSDGTEQFFRSPSGRLLGLKRGSTMLLTASDRHGDVAWTLNPASGVVADSVVRDPFGKVLGSSGSVPRAGFQGDWTDPTSGLVWMAARWYQPATGTFLSRDTYAGNVGAAVTLNRFSYGLNDPLRFADPSGHTAQTMTNAELWAEYQRTGNIASDRTYYENEDGSYNSGVHVNVVIDENGNEVVQSVVSPTGVVTVSPSGSVDRSGSPLGFTPNRQTADTVRYLASSGATADQIVGSFQPPPPAVTDSDAKGGHVRGGFHPGQRNNRLQLVAGISCGPNPGSVTSPGGVVVSPGGVLVSPGGVMFSVGFGPCGEIKKGKCGLGSAVTACDPTPKPKCTFNCPPPPTVPKCCKTPTPTTTPPPIGGCGGLTFKSCAPGPKGPPKIITSSKGDDKVEDKDEQTSGSTTTTSTPDDGVQLTRDGKKKIGPLIGSKDKTVAEVIRERGGGGSQVRKVGDWANSTLGEAANAAAAGDRDAETAIKIAKQAGTQGKGGK
jgi:RHS repeat-associated protein